MFLLSFRAFHLCLAGLAVLVLGGRILVKETTYPLMTRKLPAARTSWAMTPEAASLGPRPWG